MSNGQGDTPYEPPEVSIKFWKDKGGTPRMTISYENPEELFTGNSLSLLQVEKMVRDYYARHDITEDVKVAVHMTLHCLSRGFLKVVTPSYAEIKESVTNDMDKLYNTDRILKRRKYAARGADTSAHSKEANLDKDTK